MLQLSKTGELVCENATPVCNTPSTANAAFDLLVALCMGCVPNMKLLVRMLTDMFYSGQVKFRFNQVCDKCNIPNFLIKIKF